MAWTIDTALADPAITMIERNDQWGLYRFRVGALETEVTVRLCRSPVNDETRYTMTHAMHTPAQAGPYVQSRTFWEDPPCALHQAVSSLTSYYNAAVKAGHKPNENWLKPKSADRF